MKYKLKLILESDDGSEVITHDIAELTKKHDRPEHLGLSIDESKIILRSLQENIIQEQVSLYLTSASTCSSCSKSYYIKENRYAKIRTLFGTIEVKNPRYKPCKCSDYKKTFSPLSTLIEDKITPELYFLEAKWSSLMSYGLTVELLKECFPIDDKLSIETVRRNTHTISKNMDKLLKEEVQMYAGYSPSTISKEEFDDEFTVLGLDGG